MMMMMLLVKHMQKQKLKQRQKQRLKNPPESQTIPERASLPDEVSALPDFIDERPKRKKLKKVTKKKKKKKKLKGNSFLGADVEEKEVEKCGAQEEGAIDEDRNVECGADERKQGWAEKDGNVRDLMNRKRGFDNAGDDTALDHLNVCAKRQKIDDNPQNRASTANLGSVDSLFKPNLYDDDEGLKIGNAVDMPKERKLLVEMHETNGVDRMEKQHLHANGHGINGVVRTEEKIELHLHGKSHETVSAAMLTDEIELNLRVNGQNDNNVHTSEGQLDQDLNAQKKKIDGVDGQSEQTPHIKRQKIDSVDMQKEEQRSEVWAGTKAVKNVGAIQMEKNENRTKVNGKRKLDEHIEARYVKRLRAVDDKPLSMTAETMVASGKEDDKERKEENKKRKRNDYESNEFVSDMNPGAHINEEKKSRTGFSGNPPLSMKKTDTAKEISQHYIVDSVQLRSIPLLDTKNVRRCDKIDSLVNEAANSQHTYNLFKELSHGNAAHAHNMKEFTVNHVGNASAHSPHMVANGNHPSYDYGRSIIIGNLPYDVKDEELYQLFTPDMGVEALSIFKDSDNGIGKGIAVVLFKSKESACRILALKQKMRLGGKNLRVSRVLPKSMPCNPTKLEGYDDDDDDDDDEAQPQRKRAKTSVSHGSMTMKRKVKRYKRSQIRSASQPIEMHIGTNKEERKTLGKRKRAEKTQRGISRSKKIRRS